MSYLISNDRVSTRALYGSDDYIAHALNLQWGKHRYVKREGSPGKWRYIYPEDLKSGLKNTRASLTVRVNSAKRNLVSFGQRARTTVSNAMGAGKRDALRTARIRVDAATNNARNAVVNNTRTKARTARYDVSALERDYKRNQSQDREDAAMEALRRAHIDYDRALAEYRKTPLGMIDEVKKIARNKIGIGRRKEIRNLEATLNRLNDIMYDRGNTHTIEERGRAADAHDRTYQALNAAYQDYGKTFLGSLPTISWIPGEGPEVRIRGTGYRLK